MNGIQILQQVIRSTCNDFVSVNNLEEADSMITLVELQGNLLKILDTKLNPKEKRVLSLSLLKNELLKNNMCSTVINDENGQNEVWLLKLKNNARLKANG